MSINTLYNSPADIIRNFLIIAGQVTDPPDNGDWPCYVGNMPDDPDQAICLYDTPGLVEGRIQVSGNVPEHYGFQIKLRAYDTLRGWTKLNSLAIYLDEHLVNYFVTIVNPPIATSPALTCIYKIYAASRSTGILSLGKEIEATRRNLYTINYTVALEQRS